MHFAIIACSPFFFKNASINQHQATAHHKPHRMSAATLTKKLFYSGVLEICCQVCHTANQLRHLFLDPLQRRSAFGILANSDFSSQNGEKKKHAKLSRFKYFHFPSTFPLLIFKETKNFNQKDILPPPHPPLGLHHSLSGGFTFRRRWCYRLRCLGNYLLVLWGCVIVRLLILHRDANHLRLGLIAWGNLWQPTTHLGGAFKKNGTYILYDMYIYVYTSPYDL